MSELLPNDSPRPALRPVLYPTLRDAWPWARPFTLDRVLERQGFSPGWSAVLVGILSFLLYAIVSNVIVAVGVVGQFAGAAEAPQMDELMAAMEENAHLVFGGNAIGQFVGFAFLVWLLARLHARPWAPFLRLRKPDGPGLLLAVAGWIVLLPGLFWLASVNSLVPQPEWLAEFEQQQIELLEGVLFGSDVSGPFLFLTIAITPAICEELLFRGSLQRQVERAGGVVWSIVAVGIAFGLYHLRLTQAIPLAVLGCYLGYATWASGSLFTAMLIHLLHNGLQVIAGVYARDTPDFDPEAVGDLAVPWYFGVASIVAAAGVLVAMRRRRAALVGDTPDAEPVDAVPEMAVPSPDLLSPTP